MQELPDLTRYLVRPYSAGPARVVRASGQRDVRRAFGQALAVVDAWADVLCKQALPIGRVELPGGVRPCPTSLGLISGLNRVAVQRPTTKPRSGFWSAREPRLGYGGSCGYSHLTKCPLPGPAVRQLSSASLSHCVLAPKPECTQRQTRPAVADQHPDGSRAHEPVKENKPSHLRGTDDKLCQSYASNIVTERSGRHQKNERGDEP